MHKLQLVLVFLMMSGVTIAQTPSTDTIPATVTDTLTMLPGHNKYGDLLNDDPAYNKRYPVWIPAVRVVMADAFNWTLARYFFNYDWARISPSTWKKNLEGPWVWDKDRFGVNFIGHPHSGNYYFNVARSNGYTFVQSIPFAIEGSLVWELFGEKDPPSKNDIINTPVSGAFLGEVLYRVSSNILDDRARGGNRIFRELLAGVINPTRALNRLTQGKMFRVTAKEVYQKEPLNVTLNVGVHKVNEDNKFGSGGTNAIINLQLDYGDPFEIRKRKPFDVFRFRAESRYGDDRRLIDNVIGYGFLFGKNVGGGKVNDMLWGIFQHFDYWNNKNFELGAIGFGPGILIKTTIARTSRLYSGIHLAAVPLAGNASRFAPDTSEFRDYTFGGGWEAKIEETFHFGQFASLGFAAYYYWINAYEGSPVRNRLLIFKPRVLVRLFKGTGIGFEHHIYSDNRFIHDVQDYHLVRTEQKLFLQIFFEDGKRRGRYQ